MKSLLVTLQSGPHGDNSGREGLELALAGLAFEFDVSVLFVGDAVGLLVRNQERNAQGLKPVDGLARALIAHGARRVCVAANALAARGLCVGDLALPVETLDAHGIAALLVEHDGTLSV